MSTSNDTARRAMPNRPTGTAAALTDRILVHTGTRDLDIAIAYVDSEIGGLWVGTDGIEQLSGKTEVPVVVDPEAYTKHVAVPDDVFDLTDTTLDTFLDDQVANGATVALTPTRYLCGGDTTTLRAFSQQAQRIQRTDTMVAAPLSIDWLSVEHFTELLDALSSIELPIGLICGGRLDSLEQAPDAIVNLRRLEAEVPHVMRARTDLGAYDGLAHGAFAGAIGVDGFRRHLIPPGERYPYAPCRGTPAVLVPPLMTYVQPAKLAEFFDDEPTSPPRCECGVCEGRSLTRFVRNESRREVNAHNLLVWSGWLRELLDLPSLGGRAAWWRGRCRAALDRHEIIHAQLGFRAFTPRPALRRYAELPPT